MYIYIYILTHFESLLRTGTAQHVETGSEQDFFNERYSKPEQKNSVPERIRIQKNDKNGSSTERLTFTIIRTSLVRRDEL